MPIDFNNLPDEVLLYSNDKFYEFIEEFLGVDEMTIMKVQSIRSTRSLLNVPDVLEVLSLNCKELNEIKKRLCFVTDTDEFVVKAGIKAGINALVTLLKEKNDQQNKSSKGTKSSSQIHRGNNRSSNMSIVNTSTDISVDRTLLPARPLTTQEHAQNIAMNIEKFYQNNYDGITLKSDVDYSIHLDSSAGHFSGKITCGCRKSIAIYFRSNTNSFQLSSYFKHLRVSKCTLMNKKKKLLISNMAASGQRIFVRDDTSIDNSPDIDQTNDNVDDDMESDINVYSHESNTSVTERPHANGKNHSSSITSSNKKKQKKQ